MDDLLTLIGQVYEQDGIGQFVAQETQTDIWAHITSVSRSEWAVAGQNGLAPSYVAITNASNYSGEKMAVWNGQRYSIYRAYMQSNSDDIELYLEEQAGAL